MPTDFPVNKRLRQRVHEALNLGQSAAVADYFEMHDAVQQNAADTDLGSGGVLLLPDLNDGPGNTVHLAIGAGKDSNLFVVNRDSMGRYDPDNEQRLSGTHGGVCRGEFGRRPLTSTIRSITGRWGTQSEAFAIANAKLSTTATAHTSSQALDTQVATPSISANGNGNGIVWAVEEQYSCRITRLSMP